MKNKNKKIGRGDLNNLTDIDKKVNNELFNNVTECHFSSSSNVCSPPEVLDKIKSFIETKKKIRVNGSKDIIQEAKNILGCESESCIIKNKDVSEYIGIENIDDFLDKYFKPEGPALSFGLLSNFNIDEVLDQFEKKYSNRRFYHIPFQMRDFEKVGTDLAYIDLSKKFMEGYKTFGVVFNTDYSTGRGIHWFCVFGENYGDHINIEYFNSSGRKPLKEIEAWLCKTSIHLQKKLNKPVHIKQTVGLYFQEDDHSCGVYCLAYIWLRLAGVPFKWFTPEKFNDNVMHKLRKNLFRLEV